MNKGMYIKLSKTNTRKQVGYGIFSALMPIARSVLLTIGKTLGLSALVGLASEGAGQLVKKIARKGQTGGFMIPKNIIALLIAYKHLLTAKQKQGILNALQTGGHVLIKPTRVQMGGGLGTILASIGIPIAIDLVKKVTGKGAP